MSDMLRVGLVGVGAMAQGHAKVWASVKGAKVTAVCSPNLERAQQTAVGLEALAFTDLEEMLVSGSIDAVNICTPSGLHGDQALLAATHHKHILCEKPLDLNVEKIDRLLAEVESRGVVLACVFQRRTFPMAQKVAAAVHAGQMGRVLSCSAYIKWFRSQEYYRSGSWRGTWALDGGVLANQAIHAIDHLCWLAGPVAEVEYAHLDTANHAIEAEDNAIVVLRYESGARGVIEATTCCNTPLASRIEMYGTKGSAAFDDANVTHFALGGEDKLASLEATNGAIGGRAEPMAISLQGHEIIAQDFVDAIQQGRPPMISGREARVSVDALNKIYAKAYPGQKLGV